jgi:hypothetical protein
MLSDIFHSNSLTSTADNSAFMIMELGSLWSLFDILAPFDDIPKSEDYDKNAQLVDYIFFSLIHACEYWMCHYISASLMPYNLYDSTQ